MADESRVKPQPLQPEELKEAAAQAFLDRADRCTETDAAAYFTRGAEWAVATIEEARREQPARVTDEMQKLAREIADDVFAGTKYNFGTDPRTRFAIRDVLEAAAYAGLAAVPKEDEETNG